MFVDRENELKSLEDVAKRKEGSLVILYGPRRIGKSSLLREFLKGKKAVYYQATSESESVQLGIFSRMIGNAIGNAILADHGATDWLALFRFLADYKGDGKLFVAIDELPYLARLNAALPSVLQSAWDQYLSANGKLVLILTGSSISMMRSEVLSYSAPLYGRASLVFNLKQLAFKHISQLLPGLGFLDKLYTYFIFGGVPAYYSGLASTKSFDDVLMHVLSSSDQFYSEPSLLLSEEVKKDAKYVEILGLIAEGVNKPSEMASKAHIAQSNLYYYLDLLETIGMIGKEWPVTEEQRLRSKKISYIAKNSFAIFWANVLSRVMRYAQNNRLSEAVEESKILIESLAQRRFESFAEELLGTTGICPFLPEKIGRWWGRDPSKAKGMNQEEIDVVALNEKSKDILFGECKWSSEKIGISAYNELKRKSKHVQWHNDDRHEHFALFSKSGFTDEMAKIAEKEHVLLFDLAKIEKVLQEKA
ncbi:MAG: ATP-binding protein [Candidatus Marsarchaeota archaeon]|jgi:AAA+ ATPase superfamily predicted ATPase|nr:ATP-binding protein [Candidatus Marsarchaeota archaeon]MCL5418569.1 ATP-binding protein [Candidatus Marsarchaeota archaeon]